METTLTEWTMPSNYFGETWEGWLIAPITITRDSGCLDESNWAAQLARLEPFSTELEGSDYTTVQIVREGHWACGWIEWLAIHPSNVAAVAEAEKIAAEYDSYPVLDEDDFGYRETEAAQRVWQDCYNDSERIAYMRKHWTQFEPRDWADLMACARGRYFIGYESELLA